MEAWSCRHGNAYQGCNGQCTLAQTALYQSAALYSCAKCQLAHELSKYNNNRQFVQDVSRRHSLQLNLHHTHLSTFLAEHAKQRVYVQVELLQ